MADFFKKIGRAISGIPNKITGVANNVSNSFKKLGSVGSSVTNGFSSILDKIETLIKCLDAFFAYVLALTNYIFAFTTWFFVKFLPWSAQYFECAFEKIVSLPKCFMWYGLETLGYILYLPFRFIFWVFDSMFQIGIQDMIQAGWDALDDLDKFIHDTGDGNMGTGFHIIHFPDSVIAKCYKCNVGCFPKMPNSKKLKDKYIALRDCKTKCSGDKCENKMGNCAKSNMDDYFQK